MTVRMLVMVRLMIACSRLLDLVGGLGGVQHLEEVDAVDAHHGVVAGDDVLARDVDHLLLHVHVWPMRSMTGNEDVQAGRERARIAAEVLDRVVVALRHDLDRRPQRGHRQYDQQQAEDFKAAEHEGSWLSRFHCCDRACIRDDTCAKLRRGCKYTVKK